MILLHQDILKWFLYHIASYKQKLAVLWAAVSVDVNVRENNVHDLNEQIRNLVDLTEQQGNNGNVVDAMETL